MVKGTRNYQRTKPQIIEALIQAHGIVATAAEILGMNRAALQKRIATNPDLQEVRDSCKQGNLDLAESKLFNAIENSESWAILFYLKTQGRVRGYSEQTDININATVDTKVELEKIFTVQELEKMNERVNSFTKPEKPSSD